MLKSLSPNSSTVPPGMLLPVAQLDWTCSGQAVPNPLGVLLPSVFSFAGPVPLQMHLLGNAVIELLDMQIILQTCPASWSTVAQIIAQPSGASLKPQSGFQSQLACDSIHGCTIEANLNGVHYEVCHWPCIAFCGACRCSICMHRICSLTSTASWSAAQIMVSQSRPP